METAPFYDDVADAPPGGRARWVHAADGHRLRVVGWPLDGARGTVILLPGRTEYAEKYGPAATEFARGGLATATVDFRGQGLSQRLLADPMGGHVLRFRDFQLDVRALTDAAAEWSLPRPWHLLGHSMGGAIGLRALYEGIDVVSAAFSSPMWGIQLSASLRPAAWALSWLARHARLDHRYAPGTSGASYPNAVGFEGNLLTGDDSQFAWMARQVETHPELGLGGPSLRWLNEALRECRALSIRPAPPVPCLTVLGTEEQIVDPLAITRRMAHWPDGRLLTIEGGRHETMMETPEIRTRVFDAFRELFQSAAP